MKMRKLTDSWDMKFGSGSADYHSDSRDMVAQNVMQRLKLFAGEWFLDRSEGTPWGAALGKHKTDNIRSVVRSRIAGTNGVRDVVSVDVSTNVDTRNADVHSVISTIYGEAILNTAEPTPTPHSQSP